MSSLSWVWAMFTTAVKMEKVVMMDSANVASTFSVMGTMLKAIRDTCRYAGQMQIRLWQISTCKSTEDMTLNINNVMSLLGWDRRNLILCQPYTTHSQTVITS